MHPVNVLTTRALTPLVLLFIIFFITILDVNARPKPKKTNQLDNEETRNDRIATDAEDTTHEIHSRKRRYQTGMKFNKALITWMVVKYSTKLTQQEQDKVFTDAFQKWASVSAVNFAHVNDKSKADILITFTKVDGPGKALGHAYPPDERAKYPGDIFLDEEEKWVTTTTGGINLVATILHEIGHALGLMSHSQNNKAVMAPRQSNSKINLHAEDIDRIRRKYGKCKVENITAVLHHRTKYDDTVVVINKGKVYRIWVHDGGIFDDLGDKWPKDVRTYFQATSSRFDNVFPLRGAMFIAGYNFMYLYGQKHLIRRQLTWPTGFKEVGNYMWSDSRRRWTWLPREGPLPYDKPDLMYTPDFFKDFMKTNTKFGAAFEDPWQHYFGNGLHYKIHTHDFNQKYIKDINIEFPGVPQDPDAAWFDQNTKEWWFFKGDKYFKLDKSTNKFTDRGPIGVLWPNICD